MNAVMGIFSLLLVLALDTPGFAQEAPAPQRGLRLNLSPKTLFDEAQRSPNPSGTAAAAASAPPAVSQVKLFQSGDLSAALGRDGKIYYRLPSPSFLGTKLGGQISTNSAKLTLTWPPKN